MKTTLPPDQVNNFARRTANCLKAFLVLAAFTPTLTVQAQSTALDRSNWAVSASNGNNVERAIDQSLDSRWTTKTPQKPGQTFIIDIKQPRLLDRIEMVTASGSQSAEDYARSYELNLSQDGINWGAPVSRGNGSISGTTLVGFEPQEARYLRITQTGSDSFYWWSIHDINVYAQDAVIDPDPDGSKILERTSWSASASNNAGSTNKAFDENLGSRWSTSQSQRNGQTFTLNMGEKQAVDKIVMTTKSGRQSDDDHPRGYTVELSNDGQNFGAAVATGAGNANGTTTIDITRQNAQFIRITQTGSDSFHWWSIHDLNVFGVAGTVTNPENTPPTAEFVSPTPADNSSLNPGDSISVKVNAGDADGSIDNVSLYVDNQLISQDLQAPYQWSSTQDAQLSDLPVGRYELRADATDNVGALVSIVTSFLIEDDAIETPLTGCNVSGDLKQWHRVAVTCEGPVGDESSEATFTNNRFNVIFSKGNKSITVPGHFAADGNAADTSAKSGNQWRAYFSPPERGSWNYRVSFRTGNNIAVENGASAGQAVSGVDGLEGNFDVSASGNVTRDMRTRGLLEHRDGERTMRFAGTNDVFIQGGMDSPENIFGYDEFDDTTKFSNRGSCKGILHSFNPHEQDWNSGDPTWGNGRGKSLIGLVNYIAGTGANSAYIMMNTVNGDGCDAHPWTSYNANGNVKSFDVSKLDQWERVLGQMTAKGLLIHVMTQETENDGLLNNRNLGLERKLYYRELISRFGHHPALQWNLGEENNSSTAQLKDYSRFFKDLDPYQHPVFVHPKPRKQDRENKYAPLLGEANFDGPTIQTSNINDSGDMYDEIRDWINRSTQAGNPWVVTLTEASGGGAPFPNNDVSPNQRIYWMWASVMSGGGGFEWYLKGQNQGHALDLSVENLRDFDNFWKQSGHLVKFFRDTLQRDNNVNLENLDVDNNAISGNNDWVLSSPGNVYVAMLRKGGNASLNLQGNGNYKALWFNPRSGNTVDGGVVQSKGNLGSPPSQGSQDWVVLLSETSDPQNNNLHPDIVRVLDTPLSEILRVPGGRGWADSYSVGDQCFCETTFDHNIGPVTVDTPLGRMTVRQACERIGRGPGSSGRPLYNDVQCGNGPANDAGDEDWCPGRVDLQGSNDERKLGCNHIGPKWKF